MTKGDDLKKIFIVMLMIKVYEHTVHSDANDKSKYMNTVHSDANDMFSFSEQ